MMRPHRILIAALFFTAAFVFPQSTGPVANGLLPGPFPLFPPRNWCNLNTRSPPADPGPAPHVSAPAAPRRARSLPPARRPAAENRRVAGAKSRSRGPGLVDRVLVTGTDYRL